MDFDLSWLLLGLPITFVLGWFASRIDLRLAHGLAEPALGELAHQHRPAT